MSRRLPSAIALRDDSGGKSIMHAVPQSLLGEGSSDRGGETLPARHFEGQPIDLIGDQLARAALCEGAQKTDDGTRRPSQRRGTRPIMGLYL